MSVRLALMATISAIDYPNGSHGLACRTPSVLWSGIGNRLLGLTFFWYVFPETLTGDIYVFDVLPVRFALFYAAVIALAIAYVVEGTKPATRFLGLALLACALMMALGYYNHTELKFWIIDLSNFVGFILGLHWAAKYRTSQALQLIRFWYAIVSCILLFTVLGLIFGYVPPAGESERAYVYSMFVGASFVTWLFPICFLASHIGIDYASARFVRVTALLGMGVVFLVAIFSATRSIFLAAIASVLLVLLQQFRGKNAFIGVFLACLCSAAIVTIVLNSSGWQQSHIADRLSITEISEEERYTEVEMMFEDLTGSLLTGRGFGSRFESSVNVDGETRAVAPHVGVLTLFYKGGGVIFALFIMAPILMASRALLLEHRRPLLYASAAGVLLYVVQSSMSNGWDFMLLFVYGAMISFTAVHLREAERNG